MIQWGLSCALYCSYVARMAAISHSEIRLRNHSSDSILLSATGSSWGCKKVMRCLRFPGILGFFLAAFIHGTLKDLSKHPLRYTSAI